MTPPPPPLQTGAAHAHERTSDYIRGAHARAHVKEGAKQPHYDARVHEPARLRRGEQHAVALIKTMYTQLNRGVEEVEGGGANSLGAKETS